MSPPLLCPPLVLLPAQARTSRLSIAELESEVGTPTSSDAGRSGLTSEDEVPSTPEAAAHPDGRSAFCPPDASPAAPGQRSGLPESEVGRPGVPCSLARRASRDVPVSPLMIPALSERHI